MILQGRKKKKRKTEEEVGSSIKEWTELDLVSSTTKAEIKVSVPRCPSDLAEL